MPTKEVYVPGLGRTVRFQDRQQMKRGHPTRRLKLAPEYLALRRELRRLRGLPPAAGLADWTRGGTLGFPMLGNDQYGDCMAVAAAHTDQAWTGCAGTEQQFDQAALVAQYLKASGGDNGLDEATLLNQVWRPGVAGVKAATFLDHLDVDVTDAALVQAAMQDFGPVFFMLDVPDAWVNNFSESGGAVWDAGAGVAADRNNGHGVCWTQVDAQGRYRLQTWGSYVWVTPAGVKVCDPSGFLVVSLRMFDATGRAPNGLYYGDVAALWQAAGGHALPPSPFPAPGPGPGPNPPPPTPPAPTPGRLFSLTFGHAVRQGQTVVFRAPVNIAAGTYDVSPSAQHATEAEARLLV